ncbi:hypothetical protein ALON55S_04199 [Alishewanella longhuensis]
MSMQITPYLSVVPHWSKLNRVVKGANVYAKIEARNPSFSVKCRLGAVLISGCRKTRYLNRR